MRRAVYGLVMMIAVSCAEMEEHGGQQSCNNGDLVAIGVNADFSSGKTKTTMSEDLGKYGFGWSDGDKIGLYVSGRQSNVSLSCSGGDAGVFSGYMKGGYPSGEDVEYVGYYPYRNADVDGRVSALLSRIQTAPFESGMDYMVSGKFSAHYDEADMPSVSLQFSNHLFSIIRITVTNDVESLKDEKLSAVMLSSEQTALSGYFTFNPLSDDCRAVFSSESTDTYKEVVSVYPEDKRPVLGMGVAHKLYFIVNCAEIPDLKVTVSTTDGKARVFSAKESISLERNAVMEPAPLMLSRADNIIDHKIMALWGDSITAALTYSYSIQRELEPWWTVIKCGVNGDNSLGIAARQGGVDFITGKEFTISDASSSVDFGGFFAGEDLFGRTMDDENNQILYNVSFTPWFTHPLRSPWINPIRLELEDGGHVDCETFYVNGEYKLKPVGSSGVTYPLVVPARTRFTSCGARDLADADLTVIYSGTNGGYRGEVNENGHYTGYDVLVKQQRSMTEHLGNNQNYLVLGYHFNSNIRGQRKDNGVYYDVPYWTDDYRNTMSTAFGRHFIDLKTEGSRDGGRLLIETGVVTAVQDISVLDRDYMDKGEFPASFTDNPAYDVHPNEFGNRAIAMLIKERMKELGLL